MRHITLAPFPGIGVTGAARKADWPSGGQPARAEVQVARPPIRTVSAQLNADLNRERVAADLKSKRASIALWLAVSAALAISLAAFINQLALLDAALACAGRV